MLKKLEKKRRVLELGFALGFALTVLLTAFAAHRRQVADRVCADTVRLHILANSDTLEDQLVKLQVRDAILAALPDSVLQADTTTGAEAALRQALPVLHQAAQQALYKAHSPQTARLKLERLDFAPRDYGSFALRAGATPRCGWSWGRGKATTGFVCCTPHSVSPVPRPSTPPRPKTPWCLGGMRSGLRWWTQ